MTDALDILDEKLRVGLLQLQLQQSYIAKFKQVLSGRKIFRPCRSENRSDTASLFDLYRATQTNAYTTFNNGVKYCYSCWYSRPPLVPLALLIAASSHGRRALELVAAYLFASAGVSTVYILWIKRKEKNMKKINFIELLSVVALVILLLPDMSFADSYTNTIDTYKKSDAVQPFFKNAYGYAVFPTIGKGGLGIGGAYGKGQVYEHGKVTGETSMIKASIGFQAGGQAYSQIIFFEDKRAYDEFTSGNFEFDATASAVAITAGVEGKVGTEGTTAGASAGPATGAQAKSSYHKGMAVFVHAKGGLMYEAAIGGQKFSFEPKK